MMTPTDELLVQASRDGDRTAFATLVTRYRDVVVRVAYSRLGEFNSSEDIAQQTFVTAWNRKFDLTDPSKIAAWLCGIARNLVLNERRRIARVPTDTADSQMLASSCASPLQLSIEREESELLWKVLQTIPETYREPMILFYREHASTADVANALSVTEEVVRQRLSRGRKLLEAKVAEYVEQTLTKRRTSQNFNSVVLAMLPTSAASKSTGVLFAFGAKLILGFGAVFGPVIGLAGAVYGTNRSLDSATSVTERRYIRRLFWAIVLLVVSVIGGQLSMNFWLPDWNGRPIAQVVLWVIFVTLLSVTIARGNRRLKEIKLKYGTDEEREAISRFGNSRASSRGAAWNLVGSLTGAVSWMIIVAALERDWVGLLFVIVLLLGVLTVFLPKVRQADTASGQSQVTWQAAFAIVVGTIVIVAIRWSIWSNQIPH